MKYPEDYNWFHWLCLGVATGIAITILLRGILE